MPIVTIIVGSHDGTQSDISHFHYTLSARIHWRIAHNLSSAENLGSGTKRSEDF